MPHRSKGKNRHGEGYRGTVPIHGYVGALLNICPPNS